MKNKTTTTRILFLAGIFIVAFGVVLVVGTPDDSIVGLWHFDEGTGSTAADSSGCGHDGTLSGGKFGNALKFDGFDDGVYVADSPSLDFSAAITIEAWIYLQSYTNVHEKDVQTVAEKAHAYYLNIQSGQLSFYWYGLSIPGYHRSPNTLPLNTWIHVAATYDGSSVRLFENGVEVYSLSVTGTGDTSNWHLGIGYEPYKPGDFPRYFEGTIDEVRISNVARTTFGLTGPLTADGNSVALWHFDESVDSTAYDETANNNDGAIYGAFWAGAGPTWTTEGKFDGALEFDGFDDYVLVADPGDPNNLDGFTGLTLAAWINPDVVSDLFSRAIISKYDTKNAFVSYYLSLWENEIRLFVGQSDATYAWKTSDSADLTAGSWVHVAGTWDGSVFKLYVNGTEKTGTNTIFGEFPGSMLDSTIQVDLGAFEAMADGARFGFFDGKIDDAQIYNRVLSANEIAALAMVAVEVDIDIKPGSDLNSINLGSRGNVPVAIFSTPDFDATTVDPLTVTLAGAYVKLKGKGTPMSSVDDVDGDGRLDLIVHVDTTAFELTGTETDVILEGETFDGIKIRGEDTVRIVPE